MRLQLHAGFAFPDVERIAPYLASLGVSHLYLSPITTARPGSMHGYDVIDPTRVNPELGGEEALRRLVARLRSLRLGVILDIVPNHMAACEENPWWWDVLKHGRDSRFEKFFDIDWESEEPELRGKLLLPVLGKSLDEALSGAELRLVEERGEYFIRYCDRRLPISPDDRSEIAASSLSDFDSATKGGRQRLTHLLSRQNYKLAWWRVAADEINWRRFFDVNELVALRMEDEDVFESVHSLIFRLYEEGLIDGVRVDHVDGLADPGRYCRALRRRLQALHGRRPPTAPADPPRIFVEKILLKGENLPGSWEADGTSGYDFMDQVSLLQHDDDAATPLAEAWSAISGRPRDFAAEEQAARRQLLGLSFSGQLDACARSLHRLARAYYPRLDVSRAALRRSLAELLAHFPIYRSYGPAGDAHEHDRPFLADAFAKAQETVPSSDRFILDLLQSWLTEPLEGEIGRIQRLAATQFQQLSAPVAAKAVEDTAAYRYGRLISRNDVGFDMARLGCDVEDFHRQMAARQRDFPRALLATATHDHKRGEDVRARLAVLSEIPEEWTRALRGWIARSRTLRQRVSGSLAPNDGDVALLFQTLVGSWPLDLGSEEHGLRLYAERIAAWQLKALREAKLSTDWIVPNQAYEDAARNFVMRLLAERRDPELLDDVAGFVRTIASAGAVNALAQTLLKLTVPGTPDFYQGADYWDFSLVDPDNRRPVDFDARQRSLGAAPLERLAERWETGEVKQALIARILNLRREAPRLFAEGDYRPLRVAGRRAQHLVAFSRSLGPDHLLVAVPRLVHSLLRSPNCVTFDAGAWNDTWLEAEIPIGSDPIDVFAGVKIEALNRRVSASQLFGKLPVAVLVTRG